MLGLVVCQPSEMVNHFFPAPPSPPAKPPDRDKLNNDWLCSSSFGDRLTIQPRLCARNHIQPRPSTRSKKPYGFSRPSRLTMPLMVNVLYILACVSTAGAIRSEPDIANPSYPSTQLKLTPQILPDIANANTEPTTFDLFFAKYANITQDLAFSRLKLTQTEIIRLDSRKKASLYASLMQFKISINKRLSALANAILNTTSEHKEFPDTLLFTADQSPYSFKSLVLF
jgi:hypothetical protein